MYPYYVVALLFAIQALQTARPDQPGRVPTLWLPSILLIAFIGTRLQVGADWFAYVRYFRYAARSFGAAVTRNDPGYELLNWFFREIGAGIWAVNTVCATIFVFGLRALCRRQPDPRLAMMVALPYLAIVVAMGYSRQGVAIGLVMYAIVAAMDRKFVLLSLSLVAAVAFHRSAIMAVPLVALTLSDTKIKMSGVAALGLVCYVIFVSSSVDDLYDQYVQRAMISSGATIRIAMNLLPAILLVSLRRRFEFSKVEYRTWMGFALMAFATAIALALTPASTAVDRVALYVIPLQIAVLARLPFLSSNRQSAKVAVVGYSAAILFVWLNFGAFSSAWVPYRTYLWVPADFVPNRYHF